MGRCQSPFVSFADVKRIPYIQACIYESHLMLTTFGHNFYLTVRESGVEIEERLFS